MRLQFPHMRLQYVTANEAAVSAHEAAVCENPGSVQALLPSWLTVPIWITAALDSYLVVSGIFSTLVWYFIGWIFLGTSDLSGIATGYKTHMLPGTRIEPASPK
ncbi:hypothetical protein DPMN_028223 [Dreissena polymorpha]|uniref:Uncharacterized protein n=1 Tax=Dreissena polymorpha TaxID=45954 RepID=A0A9D4REC9_DREPO|nr:hypothetical protein DPMN_028223 [Dreissena polymorpha]